MSINFEPIFASIFRGYSVFFPERLPDYLFLICFWIFAGKVRVWEPPWSNWPSKCLPKSNILTKKPETKLTPRSLFRVSGVA